MNIEPIGTVESDKNFKEFREWQMKLFLDLAKSLCLPAHLIGDGSRSTYNETDKEK